MKKANPQNNFALEYPEYAKFWHPTKNHPRLPTDFLSGSAKKVSWLCDQGHEYDRTPHDQAKFKSRCPICAGRVAGKDNHLGVEFPDVAKRWNFARNGNLLPDHVRPKSNKKVWWICNAGHEYEMRIHQKTEGAGCPFCLGRRASPEDNLAVRFPEIASEWDYDKNGDLLPTGVRHGSDTHVWWKCSLGHSWEVSVNNRTSGRNCPHCKPQTSRLEIFFYCELAHVFGSVNWRESISGMEADILIPEHKIVVEVDGSYWHRDKHEKDAEKTKSLESLGYSVFRVREAPLPLTSDRDVPCSPTSYGPRDVSLLLRKIEKSGGFSIQETVNIRRYHKEKQQKSRMQFNEMVSRMAFPPPGKSLADIYPQVVSFWHPVLNGALAPEMFGPASDYEPWWDCPVHGAYKTRIKDQVKKLFRSGVRCRQCFKQSSDRQMSLSL